MRAIATSRGVVVGETRVLRDNNHSASFTVCLVESFPPSSSADTKIDIIAVGCDSPSRPAAVVLP